MQNALTSEALLGEANRFWDQTANDRRKFYVEVIFIEKNKVKISNDAWFGL